MVIIAFGDSWKQSGFKKILWQDRVIMHFLEFLKYNIQL